MVVEADDGLVSAGFAVVERVLDTLGILVGVGHIKDTYPDDSSVVIGLNFIFQHLDIVSRRWLLVCILTTRVLGYKLTV